MANPWWRSRSQSIQAGTWPRLSIEAIFNLLEQSRPGLYGIEFEVAGFKVLAPSQVISQLTVIG
jgi:hypothetical protein